MQKKSETPEVHKPVGWFPMGLAAVFALLELVNIFHHPMWRDELQVWMIARHSHSIAELISLKKYEGHPDAWFLVVYLITRFTNHPVWMQIVHATVASATTYVIARFSPFTRIQKILIVFGYFIFFEYATVSREYALAVLILFSFCAVFRAGLQKSYLVLALLLGCLSQTSVYSVLITLALVAALVFEIARTPSWRPSLAPIWRQLTLAIAIVTTSLGVAALHMCPPPDGGYVTRLNLSMKGLSKTLSMFWKSFVPIPEPIRAFHNTNILEISGFIPAIDQPRVMALLGVVIFCISALFFFRKPVALFAYVCGVVGLLSFKHVVYAGAIWHDGFTFILFLACLWLASAFPEKTFPLRNLERLASWFAPFRYSVLFLILALQASAGVAVSIAAFEIPFSQSRAVAEYVLTHNLDRWAIVGDRDYAVSPIAGYLDREIYYVAGNRKGSYVIWDKKRVVDVSASVMPEAARIATDLHHNVLLILSYTPDILGKGANEVASFQGAMETGENYHLYVVQPSQSPGPESGAKVLKVE
jgi:hypothetical protein